MGFYGNITNTARTQFQFDRIYANRAEMDENANADGIFMNRYVLVEYDSKVNTDTLLRVQLKNGYLYYNPTGKTDYSTLLTRSLVNKDDLVYSYSETSNIYIFYIITSEYQANSSTGATFKEVVKGDTNTPNYTQNYNIDIAKYGAGRGYDSTVWQKTYVNNVEKYVMIAELNSIVPTFDVSADAPTTEPIVPHFDSQSTDLYYKLHWQAPWGMRVKQAANASQSDEVSSYTKYTYNPETGAEVETSSGNYNADIYYNKAGFDVTKHTESAAANKITIAPTGKSGNLYNKHNGTAETVAKNDIQEVSIILPAIGNAICKVWDTMYSESRNRDVAWKYNGAAADATIGGMTRDLSTVAGCINSVHDLMGMIIYTDLPSGSAINETEYNKHLIYYSESVKKYYRIEKYNTYVKATGDIIADIAYYKIKDNSSLPWKMERANPNIKGQDNYIKDGYGYRLVEISGMGEDLNTIYGLILELRNLLETDNKDTRNTETVQGTINVLNDIINNFTNIVPGELLICNNEGKIDSAILSTRQDYSYKNEGNNTISSATSSEAQFIDLAIDAANKKITLWHKTHTTTDTITSEDKNDDNNTSNTIQLYAPIVDNCGHIVGKNINTITLPYGYKILSSNQISAVEDDLYTTITPSSTANGVYKENSSTKTTPGENSTPAATIKDTIKIDMGNKWIQAKIGTKSITLAHEIHNIKEEPYNTDFNDLTADEADELILWTSNPFITYDISCDKAGHLSELHKHTWELPNGFRTLRIGVQSTNTSDLTTNTISIVAKNPASGFTIASGNKWVQLNGNNSTNTLLVGHKVTSFEAGSANTLYGLASNQTVTNVDENNNQFNVPALKFDEAGHITRAETHTVTLPNSIQTIAIANGGSSSVLVNAGMTSGNLISNSLTDTITIDSGNRWITLVADSDNKKLTIHHNAPGAQTNTTKTGNETPSFGETFSIPEIKYDEAGHISNVTTHTVTIPNVLIGYSKGTAGTALTATDTLNQAFSKLENQISNEASSRETVISNLKADKVGGGTNEYISSIAQANGIITAEVATLPDYSNYWTKISTLEENLATANEEISNLKGSLQTVEGNLTTANGKISDLEANLTTANETIATLQETLNNLVTKVEALENV